MSQKQSYLWKYGAVNGPVIQASVHQATLRMRHADAATKQAERERHYRLRGALPDDKTAHDPTAPDSITQGSENPQPDLADAGA
jgi:hypothetical protein